MNTIKEHYNLLAPKREKYIEKNKYYYSLLYKQYKYFIPEGKKVLEVGCGLGNLLNELKPSSGTGIDVSDESIKIAKEKYSHLKFHTGDVNSYKGNEKYDYIILSGVLGEVDDIQALMQSLRRFCKRETRIIIEYYSYAWQLMLKIAEKLDLKIPQRTQNWLTYFDINNFLKLAGYETVIRDRAIIFPKNIPLISFLMNKFIAKLPIVNALTLNHFIVARPLFGAHEEMSCTILVPCRNEKGNIESAITRTPAFGSHQEFIFVEGGSKDGTYEECERVKAKYLDRDIKIFKQTGKGKGDAVRLGFDKATCDILMILDADLTMPPEDLDKYYNAIRDDKGEFINGCRLVYPMEKEAMRFLNLIANKFFGLFFSWLLGIKFKDTLCGTKVLKKEHYEQIVANRSYFGDFDPFGDFDLIFGAVKQNMKVMELPIRYKDRQYGETQIQRFRHGILLFQMCFYAMKKIKFK